MPFPRKEDNSIDWKILIIGKDWKSFLVWTMLTIAILLMAYGYKYDNKQLLEVYANPCDYCYKCGNENLNSNGFNIGQKYVQINNLMEEINPNGEREDKTSSNATSSNG